eukprot:CAMPEP_0175053248 /NCGR_PEP_ID=MMETSP0052_2-20121109/8816_1 /TAXON_ID=51329 ORGANISM="Polytomella parva, Strain SAG 63-3" /NCGR_SAMPLE_ID=MMETSP0052_2 /ASSEMBLY_ACC=CAM_ASM_000194 /LENGTH=541 /DNA_ID=CAMNT_0016317755 /DNA_START=410 /DNA_END=2035 /DNA_ORIENTATION=-
MAKTPGSGKCFPDIASKFLPPTIFKCDAVVPEVMKLDVIGKSKPSAPSNCTHYLNESSCDVDTTCVWCNITISKTPGSGKCFSAASAKFLPPFFSCEVAPDLVGAASSTDLKAAMEKKKPFVNCYNATTEAACDHIKACSWCENQYAKSGMCVPTSATKSLPKKTFKCGKKEFVSQLTASVSSVDSSSSSSSSSSSLNKMPYVPCPAFTNASACDAEDSCAWCVSGVKGYCYPSVVVKFLPPTIVCDKNVTVSEKNVIVSTKYAVIPTRIVAAAATIGQQAEVAPLVKVSTSPSPSPSCSSYVNESTCEGDAGCVWCNVTLSLKGKGACYNPMAAHFLPPSVFKCGAPAPSSSISFAVGAEMKDEEKLEKSKQTFRDDSINEDNISSVMSLYANANVAMEKEIEVSIFHCLKQDTAVACDAISICTWCKTSSLGAFGNGCYPRFISKFLPRGYFTCDAEPTVSPSPPLSPSIPNPEIPEASFIEVKNGARTASICDDKKSEAVCKGPSCVWCTSAAVGGGCYTPAEAMRLPKSIFKCASAA